MLGEMPYFDGDPMLAMYVFVFMLIPFFLALNLLIAIVVDAFVDAKKQVQDNISERSFFTDCVLVAVAFLKGQRHGWPSHPELLTLLRDPRACSLRTLGHRELLVYLPRRPPEVLLSFLRHYHYLEQAIADDLRAHARAPPTSRPSLRRLRRWSCA
jgi:hypothetical protein